MVEQFIKRKHGKEPIKYPHPALEPILRETYGVIVYQEQVMQIAQVLAGYTPRRRRQPAPRHGQEEDRRRWRRSASASSTGVGRAEDADAKIAGEIFDQMETFAAYGFNKSHSAAYALISYQTAYLKAHYPTEFMAGLLSLEMGDTDKTYKNIAECREHGIAILPPDVNESREDFTVAGEGDPLRPGRGERRRLQGDRGDHRGARADGPLHEPARLLHAGAAASW